MSILFGHPSGNPNSYHAALAHLEAGWLEAFCVPWLPSDATLRLLARVPGLGFAASRLARRAFPPLATARLVQDRPGELRRAAIRTLGFGDERLSYQANDWLMRTMTAESARPGVRAVHAYEDCSLWQFQRARSLGKACIYDMPIGCYPAWTRTREELLRRYSRWLPAGGLPSSRYARPEQKRAEMDHADLVIAPSAFVEDTVREFHANKRIARAPYGVDGEFWCPGAARESDGPLTLLFAGQLSLRKGAPLLIEAWRDAALPDAQLELVGNWQLADAKRTSLPPEVAVRRHAGREELRQRFRQADVFVFPTYFEGLALVVLEAMACGLPVITTQASGASDLLDESSGRVIPTGSHDELVHALRWFASNRERLPAMRRAARERAQACSWARYREAVKRAAAEFA